MEGTLFFKSEAEGSRYGKFLFIAVSLLAYWLISLLASGRGTRTRSASL